MTLNDELLRIKIQYTVINNWNSGHIAHITCNSVEPSDMEYQEYVYMPQTIHQSKHLMINFKHIILKASLTDKLPLIYF